MNNYATSSIVLQNLFTGLMQIGPDGGLINGCAEKYEVSGDGLDVYKRQPIIRVSVDHGTAFDQAGTGTASELKMCIRDSSPA